MTSAEDNPRSFSIVGKNLKLNSAEDIQHVLDDLDKVDQVEEVHFGGNTLGVEACRALAKNLAGKKTLKVRLPRQMFSFPFGWRLHFLPLPHSQVADFADIFTGRLISEIPDALRALCDALVDHEALVEINLSDNAFGGRSAEPMVNFLANNHHFQVLKLNNNGLGIQGGTIVANALIDSAKKIKESGKTSNLRTVICGRNRLENGSAPVWAEAFKQHGGLTEVRMFQNGIRMEGIEAISGGLSHCKNLQVLDLQDNTATVKGSRAIAAALPSWPDLRTLNLSDMLLKPKGGILILTALGKGHNTQLETLQLQYDDIDRKGLALLGPAISRHLSNLIKLEINGNWADEDDDCINDIKKALEAHGHEDALDELDEMDPEGEESDAEDDDSDDGEEAEEKEEEAKGSDNTKTAEVAAASGTAAATVLAAGGAAAAVKTAGDEKPQEAKSETTATTTESAPPAAIVGGASGTSATSVASEVPKSEPVAAVPAPPVNAASTTAEPATEAPVSNATSSVTDELIDNAKSESAKTEDAPAAPTEKEQAQVAAEVSKSAQAVPERSEQIEQTEDVAASAQAVHKQDEQVAAVKDSADAKAGETTVEDITNGMAATTVAGLQTTPSATTTPAPATQPGHAASSSVDLSNELYPSSGSGDNNKNTTDSSTPSTTTDDPARKKKGFKAAIGAVKELLFR